MCAAHLSSTLRQTGSRRPGFSGRCDQGQSRPRFPFGKIPNHLSALRTPPVAQSQHQSKYGNIGVRVHANRQKPAASTTCEGVSHFSKNLSLLSTATPFTKSSADCGSTHSTQLCAAALPRACTGKRECCQHLDQYPELHVPSGLTAIGRQCGSCRALLSNNDSELVITEQAQPTPPLERLLNQLQQPGALCQGSVGPPGQPTHACTRARWSKESLEAEGNVLRAGSGSLNSDFD